MKKWIALAAMLLSLVVLTGCMDTAVQPDPDATPMPPLTEPLITERADLYRYYNEVSLNSTIGELTERYGEPLVEQMENGKQYTWVFDDTYGFAAAAYDNGKLRAKVVYYKDLRQLVPLMSGTNLDSASLLTKTYTYDMVASTFGAQGLEIAQITTNASLNPGIARVYVWSDGETIVNVSFTEENLVDSATYGSIK